MNNWILEVFDTVDSLIKEHGEASSDFWQSGAIPHISPVNIPSRKTGTWLGQSDLGNGLSGKISLVLLGGYTRIGIFLPSKLLEGMTDYGESIFDAVSKAHDNQPANIIRRIGGDVMFDRIFTESPFSALWFRRCVNDKECRTILTNLLTWRILDIWDSALRIILSNSENSKFLFTSNENSNPEFIVRSNKPIPSNVASRLPITLSSSWMLGVNEWITTVLTHNISKSDLDESLRMILPDYDIFIFEKNDH